MAADLSALLNASKALTSHLSRPDLPSVNLSLDQIEAQSRRLVSRQPGTSADTSRANYLLAQAHVDASALSNSIAHLNTQSTFSPLQALQDTDVAGYLRHAHEQNLISTIEEGRRETQEEFYRVLEDRSRRDWEARKKRVFEQLGARVGGENRAVAELKKSTHGKSLLSTSVGPSPNLQMQSKMMAYDRVVAELNTARLRGTSFPVVHAFVRAASSVSSDPQTLQTAQNFHILSKITGEPPSLPPVSHAGAHILNAPLMERKFARAHLGDPESRDAIELRRQIAKGAREALEEQYMDVLERTLQARATEARLGGDPSVANKIRAYVLVRHYRGGQWDDRIDIVAGQPLWAKLFYLVRTGNAEAALEEATKFQSAIEHRESNFLSHFRAWVESPDRRLPKPHRDQLHAAYNAHMLHSSSADPFKLALYKLMGKIDPARRSVPQVTVTTEDWLWFQLAMVDEDEFGGLRGLAEVLLSYGERHFDGVPGQKGSKRGVWAGVLLMCGQFERAVAALWDHPETEVEAVHLAIALAYHGLLRVPSRAETSDVTPLTLSPVSSPALSLSTLIWRYVRQFVKMDAREALQYVYCVCLSSDQPGGVGKEQVENAWELVRRIIVLANTGAAWEELVGGFRPDGTRFPGAIEQSAPLLKLEDSREYNEHILIRAAKSSEEADRIPEAIKLYNLAGDYATVIGVLAHALGNTIAQPSIDEKARAIERTAADILRHYERTNRAVGKERDAVVRLLRVREAMDAKDAGRVETALELMESTDLIPMDADVAKITKRAEEFRELPDALQRNLQTFLTLTMDILAAVHQKVKNSSLPDVLRQSTLASLRKKSRSLIIFAGNLKYRMSPDVYSYLARLDVEIAL
ncbi:nucleoporin-interacting protein NIC96 [Dichomitus squalens]|uniref:Nuclear pore protein n=2 Tax=Dichomitus squalens TaxID=114155 RepID=A0A4Q9MSN3_9APHY|nr:nucleoporin-interacting protein NIC96 [Dichomitus squalens LYAD-421 SS1]EJF58768.1 nucleoporin-interacting protein NIC96 [Dichomitus squalens LYAD-421 SS1]TBU30864.1 nucleoporin-interacting protein NIC96 [Dichomitus squalens]TBU37122.1 nucleoporin-interacting protein NIC96 [Dichomitus squalens]TBU51311.1 nucleoporin-interacting protein NIC96 [Dichomitus squalens]